MDKHKVLLDSPRSHVQYPVLNRNGKECKKKKKGIYVCN